MSTETTTEHVSESVPDPGLPPSQAEAIQRQLDTIEAGDSVADPAAVEPRT